MTSCRKDAERDSAWRAPLSRQRRGGGPRAGERDFLFGRARRRTAGQEASPPELRRPARPLAASRRPPWSPAKIRVEYLAHRRRLSRANTGARDRRRANRSRPRSHGRRQVRGPTASGTEGCVITQRRPIAERTATSTPHGRAVGWAGPQAPVRPRHRQACLPSAQAERWVRIFPVCRLPVRFRTCLRRERDRQAQTGARHRQVEDLGLLDETRSLDMRGVWPL